MIATDYQQFEHNACKLAKNDPFNINSIKLLDDVDKENYYVGIVSSFIYDMVRRSNGFKEGILNSRGIGSYFFEGDDKSPSVKNYVGFRNCLNMPFGNNKVLIKGQPLLAKKIGDLFSCLDKIENSSLESYEYNNNINPSISAETDIMDFYFSSNGNGDYFTFNFHHPDEETNVSKRLV